GLLRQEWIENEIKMAGCPAPRNFCRVRCRWVRRLLRRLLRSWIRARSVLWRLRWRLQTILRRLPRLRHGRGRRSAILYSWSWVLRRADLLRLEAGTLVLSSRSKSLDPRALRRQVIIRGTPSLSHVNAAG